MRNGTASPAARAWEAHPFAVLSFDGLNLMVSQAEVRTLEPASAVHWAETDSAKPLGRINIETYSWPVFCLGADLSTLAALPPSRRVCMLLSDGENGFGLLCDQVKTLEVHRTDIASVPACMRSPASPFVGMAHNGGELMCLVTTTRLADLLRHADSVQPSDLRAQGLQQGAF